jgi:hypothetical protein
VRLNRADIERWLAAYGNEHDSSSREIEATLSESSFDAVVISNRKPPFPLSKRPALKAALIEFTLEQERTCQLNNDDLAQEEMEKRFNKTIPRNLIRELRKEAGCLGKSGRKRNQAEK